MIPSFVLLGLRQTSVAIRWPAPRVLSHRAFLQVSIMRLVRSVVLRKGRESLDCGGLRRFGAGWKPMADALRACRKRRRPPQSKDERGARRPTSKVGRR